jgi:hypothetical protein
MEEPRSRVVREEPDGDFIISTITNRHHISDNRVVEVVGRTIGAADYVEIVPVQMNGVLFMEATGLNFMILELRFGVTHWAASRTTRNCQLNALVRIETIDAAFGKKIRCFLGTAKDLE